MQKKFHGSCHCGAVTFECVGDLDAGATRCNCSYCRKTRNWGWLTMPAAFAVTGGEESLSAYRFRTDSPAEHCFCAHCGVRLFSRGNIPELGGAFVSVFLPELDDASAQDLIAAPLRWRDGLHDNWMNPPEEIRHL